MGASLFYDPIQDNFELCCISDNYEFVKHVFILVPIRYDQQAIPLS